MSVPRGLYGDGPFVSQLIVSCLSFYIQKVLYLTSYERVYDWHVTFPECHHILSFRRPSQLIVRFQYLIDRPKYEMTLNYRVLPIDNELTE